jgi:TolB protein
MGDDAKLRSLVIVCGLLLWLIQPLADSGISAQVTPRMLLFVTEKTGGIKIYLIDSEGKNQRWLTDGWQPSWSPDGEFIAYVTGVLGEYTYNIHIISVDGKIKRSLTIDGNSISPSWSPDGKNIAFATLSQDFIKVVDVESQKIIFALPFQHSEYTTFIWSPDGQFVAFITDIIPHNDRGCTLNILDVVKRTIRAIADHGNCYSEPSWSPDSLYLVFETTVQGRYSQVCRINRDGSGKKCLTDDQNRNFSPKWSPNGTYITFNSFPGEDSKIYIVDSEGKNLRWLTNSKWGGDSEWSPDSQQIAYTASADNSIELYIMNADGSNIRQITQDMWPSVYSWQPQK